MRPLAVLMAMVFGSAAAISFGLTATVVVFLVLRGEQPELRQELPSLLQSCAWFWLLSTVAGAALYSTLRRLRWRMAAQFAMCAVVAMIAIHYWPD